MRHFTIPGLQTKASHLVERKICVASFKAPCDWFKLQRDNCSSFLHQNLEKMVKKMEKGDFDQRLECTAPKNWLKYKVRQCPSPS